MLIAEGMPTSAVGAGEGEHCMRKGNIHDQLPLRDNALERSLPDRLTRANH